MKVILKSDVEQVGRAGEILKVKNGFARNFLFPRKLALPADAGSLKEARHKEKLAQLKAKKALILRKGIKEKLEGLEISFQKKAGAGGRLFGSVSAFEIAKALKEKGFAIDKKYIGIEGPLKTIGDFDVPIDLALEKSCMIKVKVESEKLAEVEKKSILSRVISKTASHFARGPSEKVQEAKNTAPEESTEKAEAIKEEENPSPQARLQAPKEEK